MHKVETFLTYELIQCILSKNIDRLHENNKYTNRFIKLKFEIGQYSKKETNVAWISRVEQTF